MKADGVEVVELGTGEGTFRTAARALYEGLGFHQGPDRRLHREDLDNAMTSGGPTSAGTPP